MWTFSALRCGNLARAHSMPWRLPTGHQLCRLCLLRKPRPALKIKPSSACVTYGTDSQSDKENKRTVEKLSACSVDIRKIRRLKGWVLLEEETYVEEIANILKELGANKTVIASILERCPEAIICSPAAVNTKRKLADGLQKRGRVSAVNRAVSRIFLYCQEPGEPEAKCSVLSRAGTQKCGD